MLKLPNQLKLVRQFFYVEHHNVAEKLHNIIVELNNITRKLRNIPLKLHIIQYFIQKKTGYNVRILSSLFKFPQMVDHANEFPRSY